MFQNLSLCGISHNGLPRVTACMSMQGIHCVFATHLVDRKNDNSWLTSILWIYTVVDSYNPSHIAGISLATHESCIRTNKYWNSWGIPRRWWQNGERNFIECVLKNQVWPQIPSKFPYAVKTFDNCGLKIKIQILYTWFWGGQKAIYKNQTVQILPISCNPAWFRFCIKYPNSSFLTPSYLFPGLQFHCCSKVNNFNSCIFPLSAHHILRLKWNNFS